MERKDYQKIKQALEKQEAVLRFDHFSNQDAWELGKFLVQKVNEEQIELAISIQRLSGYAVFQYGTETTSWNNQNWMRRKFNTVSRMGRSSMSAWATAAAGGEQLEEHGLNQADYVFCGGGFPIRLKTGEMVAVLLVSNLPHEQDHAFIVESLGEWLGVDDVPVLDI